MRTMKSQIKLKKWNKELGTNLGFLLLYMDGTYKRFDTRNDVMGAIKKRPDDAKWVFDLSDRITINHEVEIVDEISENGN